jgi:hypothetical protein
MVSDGCLHENGMFSVSLATDAKTYYITIMLKF